MSAAAAILSGIACSQSPENQARQTSAAPEATAASSASPSPVVSGPLGEKIDNFLTRMSGFGYSGNVLVLQKGTVLIRKGYGLANRKDQTPYTAGTIFDIGSMAKTFTAAAIVKLELDGRLSVKDPIDKFLTDVPQDKRGITIQQLLTHTSGIASDFPYSDPSTPYEDVGRDEALRRILKAPLEYAPGQSKGYSNGGYILLAAVVEKAAGEPFRQYMHRAVIAPAGLKQTGFWGDKSVEARRVAIGYNEYGEPQHDPMTRSTTTWQDLGGGQMLSTLDDLNRWITALSSGRLLPSEAVARLWTPWTKELSARDGAYGYGWFIGNTPRQTTVIQHGGDYLGTGAELEWFREEDVVMITSTNVRTDLYPTRNRTDRVIPKLIFGGDHPEPPQWAHDDKLLRAALGSYRLPGGGVLQIHDRDGHYFLGARGQDATDVLMPAAEELRKRRATLTAGSQRAMDGLREGNLEALKELAGGPAANPGFITAVKDEIAGLGHGPIRVTRILGTFSSGYPRGQPLDYETTLVDFEFEQGQTAYAIRWSNQHIAATEVPAFKLAADTPIQADGKGGLVTWNIVFSIGLSIEPKWSGKTIQSLRFQSKDGQSVIAERVQETP